MENIREKTLNGTRTYAQVLCLFTFLFLFFSVSARAARAADLFFSPFAGTYTVGEPFVVSIKVSSLNETVNAFSGTVSFSQDKLEVVSLSKTGSVVGLWVQEPTFSNETGTVNFEGVVLNPGFSGKDGKIITVNFKAKNAGTVKLSFASASVLANDGKGTNVLNDLRNAEFGLNLEVEDPQAGWATTPASAPAGIPFAPLIVSPTHPDSDKWYANRNPEFVWEAPDGVTEVRLLYNRYPNSPPTVLYATPIKNKKLKNIPDGLWYFHVQFRNENGWGAISHFRFQIDTVPPEPFVIVFPHPERKYDPRPVVLFNTTDALSGIDYYTADIYNNHSDKDIKVGIGEVTPSNPFALPPQLPGAKTLVVKAYDKAGNYASATGEFTVMALDAPIFTDYPKTISKGSILRARGTTYPNATVHIFIQEDSSPEVFKENVKSDASGEFDFIFPKYFAIGSYKLWATVTDDNEAQSNKSEPVAIAVTMPALFRIGSMAVNYFSLAVAGAALAFGFIAFVWYGFHRFMIFRRRIRKELSAVEKRVHGAFNILRNEMKNQIKLLEKAQAKRALTEEEEKMLRKLKENLDETERMVEKEIEDIEKKV